MEMYGISQDEDTGENRLKGPGVFDKAGVAQMGGRTPFRLAEFCGGIVGQAFDGEERRIYAEWLENGRNVEAFKRLFCDAKFCPILKDEL